MSESIVRKIQPFTIGTKLSAPAVPKCSDFPDGFLPNRTFSDNCTLRHLNKQVSLYLGRDRHCRPAAKHRHKEMSDDHLNRNTVSPPNAASRSIRKITISSRMEAAKDRLTPGMELKKIRANSENINNNNNITTSNTQLPKIVGVSCENKPSSQFKVLLCKDGEKQCSGDREKFTPSPQTQILKTQARKDVVDSPSCEHKDMCLASKVSLVQSDQSFTHQNTIFNKEITQAETWIRAKLRDLRDASNVHRCPLTDWEEVCQTLQRDLKDFENTIFQLNQMGEQLMCKLNPTADLVKKHLAQIRDQWNALKQTAANQIKAMGGAKALQEFNKKVDRLEAWIKAKEQEQSLANILGENTDKMQLTRKILDLKQDEQLYHNLHEEINHMALRLEKQGKTEGKTISTRRKHINKMWLKAQSHLKEYQENLQLALEVSSFYQQADNIVCSIDNMRKSLSASNGVENARDGEIRDVASQIMMLDVSVSQLSNLHPALAARVAQKQSEVKDCWAILQKILRNEKAAQLPSTPSLTRDSSDPETQSSVGTDPHRIMGKEVKQEQNRLKGFTAGRDAECYGKPADSRDACASDVPLKLHTATESGNALRPESSGHTPLHTQLQKFTVSADKTLSWLKDSVAMATQICSLAGPNGFEAAKRRQASLEQDILSNRARIELVKKEGYSLVRAQHPGSIKIQEFLSQLEVLWDELKRRHERNGLVLKVSEELNYRVVRMLQSLASLEACRCAVSLTLDRLFWACRGHDEPLMEAIGNPVKELREAVEMLNDTARERGRSQSHDQSIQELLTRHAMVSARVEQCLQRCAELAVDVLEMESEMAVRCEPDRCGLDDLQEYQDQLEIRERMEELRSMLGWILVHWRAQKDQLLSRQKAEEAQTDAIYSEATVCSLQTQVETSPEASQKGTESLTSAPPGDMEDSLQHNYEYEVMKSVSPKGSDDSGHLKRPNSPYLVLKEPSPSALGGTVNLILSFSNSGDTQIQVQAPGREGGVPVLEPVHRPHTSACKSFWKRCQGIFGSLKQKKKIYRHSAEEVSTYLHVTENNTAVYESMTLPQDKASRPSSSSSRTSLYAFSSPCTSPYSSSSIEDTLQQTNNLLPKNSNISIFSSLKRKSKKAKKKKDDRRHTIQKIMGEELSEEAGLPPVCEPVTYDTHTWPLKERKKRKNARKPNSDGTQVLDYIKNPLVKDIDAECPGEVGFPVHHTLEVATQGHVKNHCRFLSLGSVLSFDLPKDMSLIPSIQDVITIGPLEQKKTDSYHQDSQVDRPTALSTFKTARSPPTQKEELKLISPGEVTLKIDCKDSKKISIDTVSFTKDEFPPTPSPVVEDISFEENRPSLLSDLTNIQQKHLSGISIVPKEEVVSWGANETQLDSKENYNVSPPEDASQGIANHSSTMAEIHVCPSVHTMVHNLNGHVYHRPAKSSSTQQLSPSHISHVVLNFRANGREDSVDSGHSSSGSFKLCAEGPYIDSSDCPMPQRTFGKVPSLDAGVSNKNLEFSKDKSITLSIDVDDPVHPDHQQFEQEEEELEDIWNHTNRYRESLNSDIMYNGYQATSSPDRHREPSPKEQAVLFRKLVTASAPNLLVAEFRLPPSIQTMVGSGKQQNPREERKILDKGDRRSWAAFTQQEQVYKQVAVNETASDMVKLPEIEDQQKYIYHYKEEEEEEEKETGFLKDQSMSLLSVHMGLDGTNDNDIQSGRQELELPSMEGTLERKHKLQLGGKKAPCRVWNSYHAVLYKQTICFYKDSKDTLKSCVTSLPLNLIGAVCEPSPEYTKKPNCFCLRLRDGSEYLLSASSRFMMKKWILRIQAHTASSDSVVNRSTCHGSSASATLPRHSPAITGCQCGDKCHCSMRNYVTTTVLAQSQPASGRTKEIIVHTNDGLQIHQRHQDLLLPSFSDAGHCEDEFNSHGEFRRQNLSSMSTVQGWTSEKRRSHSFTSATYQRIKPVAPPSGKGQDSSSSYSVTLFIRDGEMPSVCKSTATAPTNGVWQESVSDLPIKSYMSLPRPPNKSVFRKFFGKKE
ncbi:uncharacterized protein mymx [Sinocyclocheilus rhinocerous]|uniref:uncharacterized protein mymx n=1 Tax=Sinocyclocheilus rhinocerous TaxID=307959 RepID=UPI0007B977E6|nr:PREDICTED: uncharacterized protein LOC107733333 [Sinocyclocheilus rhinocerous]